ncbi:uncharacterized protein LOC133738002 [Rosa rugosa]|uniref:uncharacterized protein LOC133738002 n=1 Tax=Rosa rugosa TaxID=74645 RepID=UPI002B40D54B|nr:uncharacterized protein LOC133738002 [Rosa rugosa]
MVVHAAASIGENYRRNNPCRFKGPASTSQVIRWLPPPAGFAKLNFDGSVVNNKKAAAGFVIRDHDGSPLFAGVRAIGHASVPIAEGSAVRDGLYHALLLNCRKIYVEGDSKLIIDSINKKCAPPWRLRTLVKDILSLASNFEAVSFSYVPREANFVADAVTNMGHRSSTPITWSKKLPFSALFAFNFDQFSSGCSRGFKL